MIYQRVGKGLCVLAYSPLLLNVLLYLTFLFHVLAYLPYLCTLYLLILFHVLAYSQLLFPVLYSNVKVPAGTLRLIQGIIINLVFCYLKSFEGTCFCPYFYIHVYNKVKLSGIYCVYSIFIDTVKLWSVYE